MSNSVLDNPPQPGSDDRLKRLEAELKGQQLIPLLEKLMARFDLSKSQLAEAAEIDPAVLNKLLHGEHREFKTEHVDALMGNLERQGKFAEPDEVDIWTGQLKTAAVTHYLMYKIAPRVRRHIRRTGRVDDLDEIIRAQLEAWEKVYTRRGGRVPALLPLVGEFVREMRQRWGWVRVPEGYRLQSVEGDRYSLISTDLFPKKLTGLDSNVEVKDTGFGTYTIRRKPPPEISVTPGGPKVEKAEETKAEPSQQIRRMGGLEWVRIPAGPFWMGSRPDNALGYDDEKPQHTVDIPHDYWIARTPMTNAQFREFVVARGYSTIDEQRNSEYDWLHPKGRGSNLYGLDDHPVVQVSWHDARAYCEWLTKKLRLSGEIAANEVVRLPTEAEWEKAARGEYGNEWPWGNEWDASKCNSAETNTGGTTPVGQYSPAGDSPYGVADMAGNVWEWCSSLIKPYPYKSDDGREDLKAGGTRVVRGGAWNDDRRLCRAAVRYGGGPGYFNANLGFRVARSP